MPDINELENNLENITETVDDDEIDTPAELDEILEDVPADKRNVIKKMIFSSFQMRSISSPETAVMKKLTPEHISKYLEGAEQEMQNSYKEKFHKKVFILLTMLIAMIFVIVIVVLLKENPEIMEKVLYTLGGVVAGAFGGYGLGRNQKDE